MCASWEWFQKLNQNIQRLEKKPYGIYLQDILTQIKNYVYLTVFSIALFIITKDWNPLKVYHYESGYR